MSAEPIVIDATNQIMGRLASYAAKSALSGNTVIVLNAEKAVISGKKSNIVEEAMRRLKTRTLANQETARTPKTTRPISEASSPRNVAVEESEG